MDIGLYPPRYCIPCCSTTEDVNSSSGQQAATAPVLQYCRIQVYLFRFYSGVRLEATLACRGNISNNTAVKEQEYIYMVHFEEIKHKLRDGKVEL
jgi:hypothetical protein